MTEGYGLEGLLGLISTTEEILFSFSLPLDVIKKYEGLKK